MLCKMLRSLFTWHIIKKNNPLWCGHSYCNPSLPLRRKAHREVSNYLRIQDSKMGALGPIHNSSFSSYENLNQSLKVQCLSLPVFKWSVNHVCHTDAQIILGNYKEQRLVVNSKDYIIVFLTFYESRVLALRVERASIRNLNLPLSSIVILVT